METINGHYRKINSVDDAAKTVVEKMRELDSSCIGLEIVVDVKGQRYNLVVKQL